MGHHRTVGVGRDLCGSSSPTPLPKQGHLQQAAQDLVQVGFEYLQRRRLHSPSGQPVPVLKEVLPYVMKYIIYHYKVLRVQLKKGRGECSGFSSD